MKYRECLWAHLSQDLRGFREINLIILNLWIKRCCNNALYHCCGSLHACEIISMWQICNRQWRGWCWHKSGKSWKSGIRVGKSVRKRGVEWGCSYRDLSYRDDKVSSSFSKSQRILHSANHSQVCLCWYVIFLLLILLLWTPPHLWPSGCEQILTLCE